MLLIAVLNTKSGCCAMAPSSLVALGMTEKDPGFRCAAPRLHRNEEVPSLIHGLG